MDMLLKAVQPADLTFNTTQASIQASSAIITSALNLQTEPDTSRSPQSLKPQTCLLREIAKKVSVKRQSENDGSCNSTLFEDSFLLQSDFVGGIREVCVHSQLVFTFFVTFCFRHSCKRQDISSICAEIAHAMSAI